MADWNDLKKAFENDVVKKAQNVFDEQSLLESIAKYLAKNKGISALQGYDADEMLEFLQKPAPEIKKLIGGQWESLEDDKIDTLVYNLIKKVKKSIPLLDRSRKI